MNQEVCKIAVEKELECDSPKAKEIKVFKDFVAAAVPSIVQETVQKREPPEPDILCEDSIEGYRAFELVELLDKGYAHRRGHRVKELEIEAYKQLSCTKKAAFDRHFGNASLNFSYVDNLTETQREKIIPCVLEKLMALPEGFTKTLRMPRRLRRGGMSNLGSGLDARYPDWFLCLVFKSPAACGGVLYSLSHRPRGAGRIGAAAPRQGAARIRIGGAGGVS